MGHQVAVLPVSTPSLKATRSRGAERYVGGLKDSFMISRLDEGRTRFWTHGCEWRAVTGSIVVHQPGDVHREVERDGFATYQILRIDSQLVGQTSAGVRMHACLEPGDPRARPMHELQDAVAAGADRFALECALAEAIGAMVALAQPRRSHTFPVRRSLAMIRERFAEPVTLDELAAHARGRREAQGHRAAGRPVRSEPAHPALPPDHRHDAEPVRRDRRRLRNRQEPPRRAVTARLG
jgi:hypothetical protein